MDSSDLLLQHGVDQPVACKHVLALELGETMTAWKACPQPPVATGISASLSLTPKKKGMMASIPDKSSISTCCACSFSINLLFRESGVIPEVSAMAALMAAEERAVTEKDDARGRDGCGVRR